MPLRRNKPRSIYSAVDKKHGYHAGQSIRSKPAVRRHVDPTKRRKPKSERTLRDSEFFDTSCYGAGWMGDWILGDWCIPVDWWWTEVFLYQVGTIYIEGIRSTNFLDVQMNTWSNYPTYCMSDWCESNDKCDAIAVIRYSEAFPRGLILGFGFVNGIAFNGQSIPGATIFIQHSHNGVLSSYGFPDLPFYIDDLLLYRAHTKTYHRLTDESRINFIHNYYDTDTGLPMVGGSIVHIGDLHFGPALEEQNPLPLLPECTSDEDCDGRMICVNNDCVVDRPTGQCYCECTEIGGYGIHHLYLDNKCFGDYDCANSCENYCQSLNLGSNYAMSYSQCIQGGDQLSVCNSNMSYNECRQFLINNMPDSDVSTFTTWYDAMGESGYRQILNNQVTQLEQLPSIQRLLPQENIRGQNYMQDNINLLFCMGCNGVYGFGRCSGTCCGVTSHDIEPIVDPYTNEVIVEGSTQHGVGCNMTL